MSGKLLTVKQVAETLQLSAKSVYRMVAFGELAAYRIGGAVRVSQADLDAYLSERRSTGVRRASMGALKLKWLEV